LSVDAFLAAAIAQPDPLPGGDGRARLAVVAASPCTIGTRTALDLRHGPPPPQLVGQFLTPEGATVIYARGGTGKGLTASWLTGAVVASGASVMILDFEGHEREWGSRLRGLGIRNDDLARIHYRAPSGSDWTAATGSLGAIAKAVRADATRLGVKFLIVDSYSVATINGDTMGGEAAAREYFSALSVIGLPSLTIAHVRGDSGRFPDRPFGSVFVHNLARETWAIERVGGDHSATGDPDLERSGPHVVALELRQKKANAGPASAAQFLTFTFHADGSIDANSGRPGGRPITDLIADALAGGPLTLAGIAAAIKEDTGQAIGQDTIRKSLDRHSLQFSRASDRRPLKWALA
jgi:hypothetical protein